MRRNLVDMFTLPRTLILAAAATLTTATAIACAPGNVAGGDIDEKIVAPDGERDPLDPGDGDLDDPIGLDEAREVAEAHGVDLAQVFYAGFLPYVDDAGHVVEAWGVMERIEGGTPVTYIDRATGEVLAFREPATERVLDFLEQTNQNGSKGSTPNSYNSCPWQWVVPVDPGTITVTCGYNCGFHTGSSIYATDWSKGCGHMVKSPASCWVLNAGWSNAYGYNVVGECGDAGSGRRYYFRIAHLKYKPTVVPGWWTTRQILLGYAGSTGNSTGCHVHFEMIRARGYSQGYFSSKETLPINRWPNASAGICSGGLNYASLWGSPWRSFYIHSDGCP